MKYIIMDLDDTLLTSDKRITDYSKEKLKYLKEQYGFIIVLNTARSYLSTLPYIKELKPDYSILNGGVLILDANENIIYKKPIDRVLTNEIIDIIKDSKEVMGFSIEGENDLYTPDLAYLEKNKLAKYFSFQEPLMEGAYKILINSTEKETFRKIARENSLEFESYLSSTWMRMSRGTKNDGNRWLFSYLKDGNPMDYTFGDDTGDIGMINEAYNGVFLINSNPNILPKGARTTKYDNNNDGVVRYLLEKLEGINEDNTITS